MAVVPLVVTILAIALVVIVVVTGPQMSALGQTVITVRLPGQIPVPAPASLIHVGMVRVMNAQVRDRTRALAEPHILALQEHMLVRTSVV